MAITSKPLRRPSDGVITSADRAQVRSDMSLQERELRRTIGRLEHQVDNFKNTIKQMVESRVQSYRQRMLRAEKKSVEQYAAAKRLMAEREKLRRDLGELRTKYLTIKDRCKCQTKENEGR